VVVVGGGISGLAAALALRQRASTPLAVTVLEGSGSVGGKLASTQVAGISVDAGAESMLARRAEAVDLARDAGLADLLEQPAVAGASVWSRAVMRPLPAGQLMGIPADLRALAASGIVSLPGLARVPLDHVRARTRVTTDISVGRYVEDRLGREVVDRLVEPLLGGVYAGHADELSLDATIPQLGGAIRVERSLLRVVGHVLDRSSAPGRPVFAGLRGGLGILPAAVAAASAATIRTGTMVRELRRAPGGWRLVVGPARSPEAIFADAVVLAVPAAPASRLLASCAAGAAAELRAVEYASVALITFAVPSTQLAGRTSGTGFLVPPVDGRLIKAATFSSRKWAWQGESARAAGDLQVLRVSIGRHRQTSDLQRTDDELAAAALAELGAALGAQINPVDHVVTRWGGALPQYSVGHLDRVARIRREVAQQPGLAVAGAAYDGVGIAACVASARAAADRVLAGLAAQRQWTHG
jgi:oxygen-dependent protoporphyrinogen oxidase